jgi:hypothetical protein
MLQSYFDRFAISLSGLCAIHCVALPVLAGVIPLLTTTVDHGSNVHSFWFHQFILLFILPVSIIALISGYRCHKQITPLLIGGTGLVILVATAIFAEQAITQGIIQVSTEKILTIFAGIIHATGHIANILATKSLGKCVVD